MKATILDYEKAEVLKKALAQMFQLAATQKDRQLALDAWALLDDLDWLEVSSPDKVRFHLTIIAGGGGQGSGGGGGQGFGGGAHGGPTLMVKQSKAMCRA